MKKMKWEVTIAEVENGYVVRVGCKLFVFPDWEALYNELNTYIKGGKSKLSEKVTKDMTADTCEGEAMPQQARGAGITESLARGG